MGDVVEVPRVDPHLAAKPMHLHANAVELPLDRRLACVDQCLTDVGRAGGQHRLDWAKDRESHGLQRRKALVQREACGAPQIP